MVKHSTSFYTTPIMAAQLAALIEHYGVNRSRVIERVIAEAFFRMQVEKDKKSCKK